MPSRSRSRVMRSRLRAARRLHNPQGEEAMRFHRHLPWVWLLVMFVPPRAARTETGDSLRGLSAAELARFTEGRTAFETEEEAAEGLGPIFNGTSCVQCHSVGATGGGSELV